MLISNYEWNVSNSSTEVSSRHTNMRSVKHQNLNFMCIYHDHFGFREEGGRDLIPQSPYRGFSPKPTGEISSPDPDCGVQITLWSRSSEKDTQFVRGAGVETVSNERHFRMNAWKLKQFLLYIRTHTPLLFIQYFTSTRWGNNCAVLFLQ